MTFANGLLFWVTFGGTVSSMPEGGGTTNVIATGQGVPGGVAADSQFVYWTSNPSGTVMRASYSGDAGTPTILANVGANGSLAIDSTNVYWPNNHDIKSVPLAGGSVSTVCTNCSSGPPAAIVVDGTDLYFSDAYGGVYKVPSAGGSVTTLVISSLAFVGDSTIDNGIVVWGSNVLWSTNGGLFSVSPK